MTGKQKFYKKLTVVFWSSVIFTVGFSYFYIREIIPDQLSVVVEEEEEFDFPLPFQTTILSESQEVVLGNGSNIPTNEIRIQRDEPFSIYASNQGSYQLGVKLFGIFQFKEIQVDVVDTKYAVPSGEPIGIYLKSNGVMVIGTGQITNEEGMVVEPAFGILQSGDYIEAINGEPLNNKESLIEAVNENGSENAILSVRRNGELMDVKMNPVSTEEGDYKLGAWVRDDTQGIGTMTYVDMNGNFGALGHGISDSDTGAVVEIENGGLYETEIMGIEKGAAGKPGVLSGVIYYGPGSHLGDITANTEEGIFGTVNEHFQEITSGEALEVGYRQDVKKGTAYIRSSISGEPKDYEIEIQKVDYAPTHKNKGMVIKVVDEELLALTGGIVQGMSGSPIIQDGKLVGAVTHVFIQDSTKGYGIFMENMLQH
ncbi:MAG: SpoIVB peptidase [Lachnospiraceae bacterium]